MSLPRLLLVHVNRPVHDTLEMTASLDGTVAMATARSLSNTSHATTGL